MNIKIIVFPLLLLPLGAGAEYQIHEASVINGSFMETRRQTVGEIPSPPFVVSQRQCHKEVDIASGSETINLATLEVEVVVKAPVSSASEEASEEYRRFAPSSKTSREEVFEEVLAAVDLVGGGKGETSLRSSSENWRNPQGSGQKTMIVYKGCSTIKRTVLSWKREQFETHQEIVVQFLDE